MRFLNAFTPKSKFLAVSLCLLLFLKKVNSDKPAWQTADMWLGVQPAGPSQAKSLKRLCRAGAPPAAMDKDGYRGAGPTTDEPTFIIQCQRAEDQIVAGKNGFGQTLTVTCPRGIGRATITLRAAAWPNPLKFRFNLKGLEGLTVNTGKGKPHELSHRDANVKPVDGGFEVVIPRDWLGEDVKSLAVQWIDFYR